MIRKPCHLSDRAVIALSGPEATPYLQRLITNDLAKLTPGQPLYAALLSPQGKILFDFLLFAEDETILIDVQKEQRPGLVQRLTMYKLRAKVTIAPRNDRIVIADEGADDPRLGTLGQRAVVTADTDTVDGTDAYHDWRFSLGVPEAADFGNEKVFAMDGGLDELNAISFTKGCYVGQELTARMKHRGTDRKRLLPFQARGAEVESGVAVTAGGIEIGTVMTSYGDAGFTLVRLDRLAEASSPITAGAAELTITKPEWLFT